MMMSSSIIARRVSSASYHGGSYHPRLLIIAECNSAFTNATRTTTTATTTTTTRNTTQRWFTSSKDKKPTAPTTNMTTTTAKKKDLPPPLPSPRQAHEEYLKTVRKDEFLKDPQSKLNQMTEELEVVRERAAAKLDAELNKSVWRRLTDPLRRYQHSMINIGAMCLAYMLAYTLFVKSKSEKAARQELEAIKVENQQLQAVLQQLMETTTIQQMAQACLEEMELDQNRDTSKQSLSSSWWRSNQRQRHSKKTKSVSSQQQDLLQEAIQSALKKELLAKIGDHALTTEEQKQEAMEHIWEESKSQVQAMKEKSPEQILMEALMEEEETMATDLGTTSYDNNKKQRRVFSM